jgi:hypothetical protein
MGQRDAGVAAHCIDLAARCRYAPSLDFGHRFVTAAILED